MSGTNGTALTDIEGVVASVNDKGIRLQGGESWLNFSKYAAPGAVAPVVAGQHVVVSLDKSGFVRQLSPMGAAPAQHINSALSIAPAVDNSVRIGRQACLNTANAYLAHNQRGYTLEELLDVASRLETWVNR